jgi:hypothetical protein
MSFIAAASLGEAVLMKALGSKFSLKVQIWLMQYNKPLGCFGSIASALTWNNLGFEDGGSMCIISLDRTQNAVVPTGTLKNIFRSKN